MDLEIYLIGLNHRTADVEVREKFELSGCDPRRDGLIGRESSVRESLILSTCNRVEVLAVGLEDENVAEAVIRFWAKAKNRDPEELRPHIYIHKGPDAVRHVFTVASSLDSMVLGEPQILGQLKEAYRNAVEAGITRVIINRLLHKAFSVAKRVRTETAVASSAVSVSYAAVELARRIFGNLERQTAMLIGAGEMAELAATHLLNSGVQKIYVANRTFSRGQELAKTFGGEAVVFDDLIHYLPQVDIIISSTGSPTVILKAKNIREVLKKRKQRPMFFIDIAVPRDIDPDVNSLDNVYLYDIDDLKDVVEENLAQRREEALKARNIVEEEVSSFLNWLKALDLQPTIVKLLDQGEDIARRELKKTMKNIGPVDENTEKALERMAMSITHKLYHEPIVFLKRRTREEGSAAKFIDMVRRIFNLDVESALDYAHRDRINPSRDDSPEEDQGE